jgi:hypothetical protein
MQMKPYTHALLAAGYIVGIILIIQNVVDQPKIEGTILLPVAMLSLFTLSAAVMAFLFIYRPMQLYLDNQKQEALRFFGKTVLTFAGLVALYLAFLVVLVH